MGRQNQTKPDINVVSDAQQAAITALLAGQTTEQAAAAAVSRSRQWVSSKLAELEAGGRIHRNGQGVEVSNV